MRTKPPSEITRELPVIDVLMYAAAPATMATITNVDYLNARAENLKRFSEGISYSAPHTRRGVH